MTRKLGTVLALIAGCAAPAARAPVVTPVVAAAAAPADAPLAQLAAVTVRGELVAYTADGEAHKLATGMTLEGVVSIESQRRGSIISIGDAATSPLISMRAGTRVHFAQRTDGVHISVAAGMARVRHGSIPVFIGESLVHGDVLAGGGGDTVATAAAPIEAEWSLALEVPDRVEGFGNMQARGRDDKMETLALASIHVDVKTAGDLAITEVTHVFHNNSAERREGTFRFPVPDGASLTGLAMEIDGKLVEGEIVEREKAREVYEQVVDSMLDPALLEWEDGNWFKLRVFPLDPNADKKVVIRYVTPLAKAPGGSWEYGYTIGAPDGGAIGDVSVTVNGTQVLAQRDVARGVDLTVPIAAAKLPGVMQEKRPDGIYTAVRIAPAAPPTGTPDAPPAPQRVAIVFDTSRSSLEGRAQAVETLRATLAQLNGDDRFVVLASDVEVAPSAPDFVAPTKESIDAAVAFVQAIEPDGASDLGLALESVASRKPSEAIYIGDGIATWGELSPAALADQAAKAGIPFEAALIGKGASTTLWNDVAGRTGGRALVVKSLLDEHRFALAAVHSESVPRIVNLHIDAPKDAVVFPAAATTLVAGDSLTALIKTPADQPVPASLHVTGMLAGRPVAQDIPVIGAVATERVAQRWAREELLAMEAADAPKDDIVKLSTDFGVLSEYTSLLVLENDEAYAKYQIERKAKADLLAQASPTVTGGDLDTLGARRASLSPDEIQPGDPEIRIPAPQDARSVVVSFPFGETKLAMWDAAENAWMVRFLVDNGTPDGEYHASIAITHADGRIETLTLPYTVDTKAPNASVVATREGTEIVLRVHQTDRRKDMDRVEVTLDDGTIVRFTQVGRGRFEAHIPAKPGELHFVVICRDHALNQIGYEAVVR
ncbi:MAG TPA: VIT and VWA domain-containing protein [Kofleriaceae bacterium]